MCASCVPHLALPAACAGLPQAVRGGGAAAAVAGPGQGEYVSSHQPVTSTLRDPGVTHKATQAA